MVATLIYALVTYFLTTQPVDAYRIVLFLFMCILISLVAQSWGLLIGACMDIKVRSFPLLHYSEKNSWVVFLQKRTNSHEKTVLTLSIKPY